MSEYNETTQDDISLWIISCQKHSLAVMQSKKQMFLEYLLFLYFSTFISEHTKENPNFQNFT